MIPRATYRVQFRREFPFSAALPLVDYWAKLGISHLYASPIGTARAGSNHGYDQVDPTRINPELGGEFGFRALAAACRAAGLGIILDIVPNHVAVGQGDNEWWLDLLQHGRDSRYADWFDVDWDALDGKLLAPFLGTSYADALTSGDLEVKPIGGRLALVAHDSHVFPLRPEDQGLDPATIADAASLHELCERQHWRLASWRSANDRINWRRFFDITELAGIRAERDDVFDAVHALPLGLYAEGLIDGVRVDHVDGLADPAGYCRRLRRALDEAGRHRPADAAPGPAYLVVEKILGEGETLDPAWLTDGTSGYDFMNDVAAVIHDPASAEPLGALWHDISGRSAEFAPEELAARQEILERSFGGQLDAVAHAFFAVAQSELATRDLARPALRRAIGALIASFSIYRTYGTGDVAPAPDASFRERAEAKARLLAGTADAEIVSRIAAWLAGEGPGDLALRRDAVRRFQQLSAPIAAKAVEDTAFYRYGRLLSRNNVGFDPDQFATGARVFNRAVTARAAHHPHAMLTTATHDHKRGEDVRARLAVLSECPDRWAAFARRWAFSAPPSIDRGDADMLHQTIVGAWPLDLDIADGEGLAAFADRLAKWQQKALREAKLRSSWTIPDTDYEAAAEAYLRSLLKAGSLFAEEAHALVEAIAPAGAAKGLVQAVLRCTVPGVPDLFQGREFWDFSLVDPDNRTPVDYEARIAALGAPVRGWRDGAIKQRAIAALLALRKDEPDLFAVGDFEPLALTGARAGDAIAFRRAHGERSLLVLAAVHTVDVMDEGDALVLPEGWWGDTKIEGVDRLARETAGRQPLVWKRE